MIREEFTEEDCGLNSSWSIYSPLPFLHFSNLKFHLINSDKSSAEKLSSTYTTFLY